MGLLRIYKDNTFEFESRGLERRGDVYQGTMTKKKDTLYFTFVDSIPKAGSKAIIKNNFLSYFGGEYSESLEIKRTKLKSR